MGVILLVLLLALLIGGLGFAIHWLWIVAVVVFLAWLIGFGVARGEGAGGQSSLVSVVTERPNLAAVWRRFRY